MWVVAVISFLAVLFMFRERPEPEPGRQPGLLVNSQPPVNSQVLDNDLVKTPVETERSYENRPQQNMFLQPRPSLGRPPLGSKWLKAKLPTASTPAIEPEVMPPSIDKIARAEFFDHKYMN